MHAIIENKKRRIKDIKNKSSPFNTGTVKNFV